MFPLIQSDEIYLFFHSFSPDGQSGLLWFASRRNLRAGMRWSCIYTLYVSGGGMSLLYVTFEEWILQLTRSGRSDLFDSRFCRALWEETSLQGLGPVAILCEICKPDCWLIFVKRFAVVHMNAVFRQVSRQIVKKGPFPLVLQFLCSPRWPGGQHCHEESLVFPVLKCIGLIGVLLLTLLLRSTCGEVISNLLVSTRSAGCR